MWIGQLIETDWHHSHTKLVCFATGSSFDDMKKSFLDKVIGESCFFKNEEDVEDDDINGRYYFEKYCKSDRPLNEDGWLFYDVTDGFGETSIESFFYAREIK